MERKLKTSGVHPPTLYARVGNQIPFSSPSPFLGWPPVAGSPGTGNAKEGGGGASGSARAPLSAAPEVPAKKKKLTYKEQREMEQLEKDLEDLAAEKAEIEDKLNSGTLPFDQLQAASERIGKILEETDEKEFRLLELYDSIG